MKKIKKALVWLKNLLTPLTIKAAVVFLRSKGYAVVEPAKKEKDQ